MYLEKTMTISSAHILINNSSPCGRIHGHNWVITVGIEGEPLKNGMLINFTEIKEIVNRYDHVLILPGDNEHIKIHKLTMKVTINNEYEFPPRDCVFIPFSQVTAENLAKAIKQDISQYLYHINPTAKVSYIAVEETENNTVIL